MLGSRSVRRHCDLSSHTTRLRRDVSFNFAEAIALWEVSDREERNRALYCGEGESQGLSMGSQGPNVSKW